MVVAMCVDVFKKSLYILLLTPVFLRYLSLVQSECKLLSNDIYDVSFPYVVASKVLEMENPDVNEKSLSS